MAKKVEYLVSQIEVIKHYVLHGGIFFRGVSWYLHDADNILSTSFKIHWIDIVTRLD